MDLNSFSGEPLYIFYFVLVLVCYIIRYSFLVLCPMSDLALLHWLWMCSTHGFTRASVRDSSISAFNLVFGAV